MEKENKNIVLINEEVNVIKYGIEDIKHLIDTIRKNRLC